MLPIDHPFWSAHHPGDRWGCQCSLEATDEPPTEVPQGGVRDEPAPGLDNNPAKSGELFSKSHPYFPKNCNECPFGNGQNFSAPRNKAMDCAECQRRPRCNNYGYESIDKKFERLHSAKEREYNTILKEIAADKSFKPIKGEKNIYCAPTSAERKEFDNLFEGARKAVAFGHNVYIMPNPKGSRSMDFILEKRGIYIGCDLKTINGSNSVGNRLAESIGQTRRVILNMHTTYDNRKLTNDVVRYFEDYSEAIEVIVFRRKGCTILKRNMKWGDIYKVLTRRK